VGQAFPIAGVAMRAGTAGVPAKVVRMRERWSDQEAITCALLGTQAAWVKSLP